MVPEQSAAAKEQVLEDAFNNLEHNQYQHAIVPGLPDTWTFQLLDKQNAEDIFWAKTPLEEHSKYSIARYLERQHAWYRKSLWQKTVTELRQAVTTGICPPGCNPEGAVPAEAPGPAPAGRRGARAGRQRRR